MFFVFRTLAFVEDFVKESVALVFVYVALEVVIGKFIYYSHTI